MYPLEESLWHRHIDSGFVYLANSFVDRLGDASSRTGWALSFHYEYRYLTAGQPQVSSISLVLATQVSSLESKKWIEMLHNVTVGASA